MFNKHSSVSMEVNRFSLFILFLVSFSAAEPIFMYAESGKISVKKISSGASIKEIKIREYDDVYIGIHYAQDLIFYIYDKKLYRIHLLDDNGNRKISGKGELFTNPNADHLEQVILTNNKRNFVGLTVDEVNQKLYISDYGETIELDLDGKKKRTVINVSLRSPVYHDGRIYFSHCPTWKLCGVYRADVTDTARKPNIFEEIVTPNTKGDIFSLAVDVVSNKLFYRQSSSISVLDTNLTSSLYPVNTRVVLSDSSFTGGSGLQAVAAYNKYILWGHKDSSNGVIHLGILNSNRNFISKKNIFVYGKPSYNFRPNNILTFNHNFPTVPTNTPTTTLLTTPKLCPCPQQ